MTDEHEELEQDDTGGPEGEAAGAGPAEDPDGDIVAEGAPDPILHNDRVLIVGKTRSGKSVLARHIASQFTGCRLTLIDPKDDEYRFPGVEPARSPSELDLQAPISHFVPTYLSDDEYEEVFDLLWRARGPRVIQLDESYGPTRANFAPKGLRLCVQQGAKHNIGLIACSQRPVNIESTLRTEAEHIIIFNPPPPMLDTRTLAGDMHMDPEALKRQMADLHDELGLYSHLWYCRRTGELHRCAPLDPAWAT